MGAHSRRDRWRIALTVQTGGIGSLRDALAGVALFASKAEWDAHWMRNPRVFRERQARERAIASMAFAGAIVGTCALCGTQQQFSLAPGQPINTREDLHCSGCGLNARTRAAFELLVRLCPDRDARVYLTEQASAAYLWLRRRQPAVIGSEFTHAWRRRLRLAAWLWWRGAAVWPRFEDVTRLTLEDRSVHAIASFEVLEHVPDYRLALAEFARITRPGGGLVLTVPIDLHAQGSVQRARLHGDGRIEHLLEPEYHGDPLGQGVLSYHLFGWDLLDAIRAAGYRDVAIALPWNPDAALYSGLVTLLAQR
jgi:SAM-dependent methyltransferase